MKAGRRFVSLLAVLILIAVIFQLRTWVFDNFVIARTTPKEISSSDFKLYLTMGGLERSYLVHLPKDYNGGSPIPLVLMLHGAGGNADIARETTKMDEVSDKNRFIVVYPNGTGLFNNYLLTWNAGYCCNLVKPFGVDDAEFLEEIVRQMKKEYKIDSRRIYIAGMSNGGIMAYKMACEASDIFAAVSSVSGSMDLTMCKPAEPVSIIIFHGQADDTIPFYGGFATDPVYKIFGVNHPAVIKALSFWVGHNRCVINPRKTENEFFKMEEYDGCDENSGVVFYDVKNGGHSWPGGGKAWFLGEDPLQAISASEIIWEFFENHPKYFPQGNFTAL
ncbi:MAG: PHB depolymerase family esterase [Candidatus Pacebacteria bacterium]|nr:PHB depolymerase family esterase [Candidatus Paceibacterota bacterium]